MTNLINNNNNINCNGMSNDLSVLYEMSLSYQDGISCAMHPTMGNTSCPSTAILDFGEGGVPSVQLSESNKSSDIPIRNNLYELISATKDLCDNDSCVKPMKSSVVTSDEYDSNSVTYMDDQIISTSAVIPSLNLLRVDSNFTNSRPGTIKAQFHNSRSLTYIDDGIIIDSDRFIESSRNQYREGVTKTFGPDSVADDKDKDKHFGGD